MSDADQNRQVADGSSYRGDEGDSAPQDADGTNYREAAKEHSRDGREDSVADGTSYRRDRDRALEADGSSYREASDEERREESRGSC